jgi:hypothetical protein
MSGEVHASGTLPPVKCPSSYPLNRRVQDISNLGLEIICLCNILIACV